MPWCPKCGYEYRREITRCNDCGEELLPETPQAEKRTSLLVNVFTEKMRTLPTGAFLWTTILLTIAPVLWWCASLYLIFAGGYRSWSTWTMTLLLMLIAFAALFMLHGRYQRANATGYFIVGAWIASLMLQCLLAMIAVTCGPVEGYKLIATAPFLLVFSGMAALGIWLGRVTKG